jgi:hypothetical protein
MRNVDGTIGSIDLNELVTVIYFAGILNSNGTLLYTEKGSKHCAWHQCLNIRGLIELFFVIYILPN